MRRTRTLGLRRTITVSFAAGALAVSAVLAAGTYLVARDYLIHQRERTATGQAFADASLMRDGLLTAGAKVSDVLGTVSPPADTVLLVRRDGRWYSSSLADGTDPVPVSLRSTVRGGSPGMSWVRSAGGPSLVVGVPLPAVGAEFYELGATRELDRTLRTLRAVLFSFAVVTAVGGALFGRWAARRVVQPLDQVAGAAARIAGGELDTRLAFTEDPDLATIVGSFNSMVDALHERIERDARFTADVSHELRSPLTTLVTAVDVLERRRDDLPDRSRQALDLVRRELDRFRRSLEDLLELGRLDAGAAGHHRATVDLAELVRHSLEASGRPADVLEGAAGICVDVDKQQLARTLVNLFDNADSHGDGLTAVQVRGDATWGLVLVDDEGSGVALGERERIFERFARGGSRGSLLGTGLGLSLVAETVRAHGGAVWCTDRPGGGARFTVRLPRAATTGGRHS
ncbi:MAG: HAMP domain-containing sensor histidine kinase [Actinomycetes bacterium]